MLIGADLKVNREGKLEADSSKFFNRNGIFTKEEMENKEYQFEFTLLVMNIYYVY